ncbi:MAG: hypothetical protein QXH91_05925, partial [Candidatus Bathyarchaeia archaeon]
FKTPLWGAKAYLAYGDYKKAFIHFRNAINLFKVPSENCYFYYIRKLSLGGINLHYPVINSIFIRYNASCFEIGSALLFKLGKHYS